MFNPRIPNDLASLSESELAQLLDEAEPVMGRVMDSLFAIPPVKAALMEMSETPPQERYERLLEKFADDPKITEALRIAVKSIQLAEGLKIAIQVELNRRSQLN